MLWHELSQRYIHHAARGSRVLLFVREQRKQGSVTEPFVCMGFAPYESHEGERIWFAPERGSGAGTADPRRPRARMALAQRACRQVWVS